MEKASRVRPPSRQSRGIAGYSNSNLKKNAHRCVGELDLNTYLERMRDILGTALEGQFSAQACSLLVELLVSRDREPHLAASRKLYSRGC